MSKSKGNVVRPHDYIERFGLDAFRYFVYREMVFGQDASFTDDAMLGRYNADLANDLGNLASRVMTLLHRNCGGRVPSPEGALMARPEEQGLVGAAADLIAKVPSAVRSFQLSVALRDIWELVGASNRYIVTREPWKLAKDPARRAELETSLFVSADTLRVVAELLRPFVPTTAERLLNMLGQPIEATSWTTLTVGTVEAGTALGETVALFPRIELTVEALQQMANDTPGTPETAVPTPTAATPASAETAPAAAPAPAASAPVAMAAAAAPPVAELISYDDFMKIDLRVAKVVTAERVPKSKKLVKLLVDTGVDQRTIVAGIAEAYEPEALVGRTVAIVFNLKPAKLMGIESNGMVLAGSAEGGRPLLVSFEEPLPPGSRVR